MKSNWKLIDKAFTVEMHEALLQQHHAAQFIVMMTSVFLEKSADDSHTNLDYVKNHQALLGHMMEANFPIQSGLRLTDLSLLFFTDQQNIIGEIPLDGKTKGEVVNEVRNQANILGLDGQRIKSELHYQLPDHKLDHSSLFETSNSGSFLENDKYRSNADLVLQFIAEKFEDLHASEVRIWPHHFDTGGLIPLNFDVNGNLKESIGIGYAIPDALVAEPYYYITYWSSDPGKKLENMPPLSSFGKWKAPEWPGAVLTHTDLLSEKEAKAQHQLVIDFFDEGIKALRDVKW